MSNIKNAKMEVKNDILTITVNLKENFGLSKSGKNMVIATTSGNADVPGTDVKIGLNIYCKPE